MGEEFPDDSLPPRLDLTSEPIIADSNPKRHLPAKVKGRRPQVKIYFGCCKAYLFQNPPEHVVIGESDVWRVHCPRCGGLVEVLFQ